MILRILVPWKLFITVIINAHIQGDDVFAV